MTLPRQSLRVRLADLLDPARRDISAVAREYVERERAYRERLNRLHDVLQTILDTPASEPLGEGMDRVTKITSMRVAHEIARAALQEEAT